VRVAPGLGAAAVAVVIACHGGGTAPSVPEALDPLERAARACARIASCAHSHDAPRDRDPGACVDAWLTRSADEVGRLEACLDTAIGCAKVDACARSRDDQAATAYCRAHPSTRTACDGNRLVTCSEDDPGESTSADCAAFGATCGDSKQAGGLLARACLSSNLCPAGAPETRCDGPSAILSCHEGAAVRTACGLPARCQEQRAADGSVSALCEPGPGHHRHCETVGKRWCEEGRLVTCQPHGPFGQAVVTDCQALGLACDNRADTAACVVPGARVCDHAAPHCEGSALTFCAAGRRFHLACSEIGFSACDPDAHGVDAACVSGGP
jgi:hypothetical protein